MRDQIVMSVQTQADWEEDLVGTSTRIFRTTTRLSHNPAGEIKINLRGRKQLVCDASSMS